MKTLEIELPDALAARLEELVEAGWFGVVDHVIAEAMAEVKSR